MLKKLVILGLFLALTCFIGLVSAEEASNETNPHTGATVQTDSDKQTADDNREKDCCKEKHQHHDNEETK